MPKELDQIVRESPDQTGNEPTQDIHIRGSWWDIHIICNEHGHQVPCSSPDTNWGA